jgi:hypothetical protein
MWEIVVDERGARLVQGAGWARGLGIAMMAVGAFGAGAAFFGGQVLVGCLLLGLMVLPGVILTQTLGKRKERRITSVVKSAAVPDGVNVTLTDETNKRHEIVTDAETVRRILDALTKGD